MVIWQRKSGSERDKARCGYCVAPMTLALGQGGSQSVNKSPTLSPRAIELNGIRSVIATLFLGALLRALIYSPDTLYYLLGTNVAQHPPRLGSGLAANAQQLCLVTDVVFARCNVLVH